jgi:serine/threonine protein phosphatase PrpC
LTPRLYTGTDLSEGELHPLGLGLAAVYTTRLPDGDDVNEDSCAIIPFDGNSGVLVVADGAGGQPSGEKASELAVQALRSAVRGAAKRLTTDGSGPRRGDPDLLRAAILDGIDKANRDVINLGIGAGTTLAVAEIRGRKIRTYHVGDSQVMVIGQRGRIKLQTMSHSPVGYAVEAGLVKEHDAIMHEERHLVSNLIGFPSMHIEVGPLLELSDKDTVLIASDGLFDNLHTKEIVETCRKGQLLAISRTLAETCHARMQVAKEGEPSKPDDLTFIAFRRRVAE